MSAPVTLVLGGARSGKSGNAEALALADGRAPVYIATAEAHDDEMRVRIARHREDRAGRFRTVEAPLDLVGALEREWSAERIILVDCLTLWLSNLLLADRDLDHETSALVQALDGLAGPVIFVSNEVGLGIVPENALARRFRDAQGKLNQAIAERADTVVFMAAGLPMVLKSTDGSQATKETD